MSKENFARQLFRYVFFCGYLTLAFLGYVEFGFV